MFRILILIAVVIVAVVPAAPAFADRDDDDGLRAVPFVFVGAPGDCGPLPGSNIVTSAWLPGMGLPDNGDPNTAANAGDRRFGLLLNKNGLTTDCSAAGAEIKGVRGMRVTNPFVLGFDYRNGTHCGGGAPRFNVTVKTAGVESFHFVGNCATDTPVGATQDPAQWTTIRFGTASQSPPIPPGGRVVSIEIIFDEGNDQPGTEDPRGVGLGNIDNIFINGCVISSGRGIEPDPDDRDDRRGDND